MAPKPIDVYLEVTDKKTFACAQEWPGLARSGKTEEAALEALAPYRGRYAAVTRLAGASFDPEAPLNVVERLEGDATTAFGAPSKPSSADLVPASPAETDAVLALLEAVWRYFDDTVRTSPAELRKGPRGGGRDRDKIVAHVLEAEAMYARRLDRKPRAPAQSDPEALARFRAEIVDGLRGAGTATAGPDGSKRWPMRYAARRIAWHALDHAWEMEDRREPG